MFHVATCSKAKVARWQKQVCICDRTLIINPALAICFKLKCNFNRYKTQLRPRDGEHFKRILVREWKQGIFKPRVNQYQNLFRFYLASYNFQTQKLCYQLEKKELSVDLRKTMIISWSFETLENLRICLDFTEMLPTLGS